MGESERELRLASHRRLEATLTTPKPILPLCVCGDPLCKIPYSYCHCGCGAKTQIAAQSRRDARWIKDQPKLFILHHRCLPAPIPEEAVPFKIAGVYCRLIALSKGQYAIVNADDYPRLAVHRWSAAQNRTSTGFYAVRKTRTDLNGKRRTIWMHREVVGLSPDDPRECDHVDSISTTDNRRKNLRKAYLIENRRNARLRKDNTSGFKGVYKNGKNWSARIVADKKPIALGTRKVKEDAALLYREAAPKYHGRFARLT
jgi:hypothetical protein